LEGGQFSQLRLLKSKKLLLFVVTYLICLVVILYVFRFGSPLREEVEVYKGIVKGDKTGFMGFTILFSANTLKEHGVNLVVDEVPFFVDGEGNVMEFPYYRQLLIHNIEAAHRSGLQYCMTLQDQFVLSVETQAPHVVPEEVWPTFAPQWNKLVLEYAILAERYEVEMFAPAVEPDGVFGAEKGAEWGQEIVSQIREIYSGKILCRSGFGFEGLWDGGWTEAGDFAEGMEGNLFSKAGTFTGYDYIGFTVTPRMIANWEYGDPVAEANYRTFLNELMDYALMCAERDGCSGVIATEFGEDRVFEEGEGKLSGYFYWFDEPTLIEYWYKERLP
jgi:hypothetical protein